MVAALAVLSYAAKRRLGLVCLGLIVGSIISINWSSYVTALLQSQGVQLLSPPLSVVVGIGLVLLPGLLLLMVGPKYPKKLKRLFSSLVVAVLALTLIISEVARNIPEVVADNPVLNAINRFQAIIVVMVIVLALVDIIHGHFSNKKKSAH